MIKKKPTLKMPNHVGVIMDGNGRWAKERNLPRTEGHRKGIEAVKKLVKYAQKYDVHYLTLYAFSSENWRRPKSEITDLMGLLKYFIQRDLAELHKNNVKIHIIGTSDHLSKEIISLLEHATNTTKENTGLNLIIAFNYGARHELTQAAKSLAQQCLEGHLKPEDITENIFEKALMTSQIPDPDMIIRTSGEKRLSNFLLWQAAYSEFYFDPVLWPDYEETHFAQAIDHFTKCERRFGAIDEQSKSG